MLSFIFAIISFKLLYSFFGTKSTIMIFVVVVVLQHIDLLRSTLDIRIVPWLVAVSTHIAYLVHLVTPVWTGVGDCTKETSK